MQDQLNIKSKFSPATLPTGIFDEFKMTSLKHKTFLLGRWFKNSKSIFL